jgi:hypothetical protein
MSERYLCCSATLKDTLEQYGVAIIPRVLDPFEIDRFNCGMFDMIEQWTCKFPVPFDRRDTSTWMSYLELRPFHSMLLQCYGVGHAQHIWDVRQNPKVVAPFAKLWGCKPADLLVSFDGSGIHLPPEYMNNRGWFKKDWFHSDQSFNRSKFECVQSWVTGYDVEPGDGTLVVLEGSHKFHCDFKKAFPPAKPLAYSADWYKFDDPAMTQFYLDRGCTRVPIVCPAGSMVFWDSRTIHCGNQPVKGRSRPTIRNVAYVCMMPRAPITAAKLLRKQRHFTDGRTASHWPREDRVFALTPRTYGQEFLVPSPLPRPVLSPLGRRLAGFP